MKMELHGDALRVSGGQELHAVNAAAFHDAVKAAMTDAVKDIEIDFSHMAFLDSCGLGTLVALRKLVGRRGGVVRLLNPTPAAQQMLELTRLYRVLEVVKREEVAATSG
ncbi:MAG: anti-sigma factor antagonist [Verrucomicrobia bacterium]|nr:MAG: anti-sigma factor antagonist [Verrucomicrobiota bacterium]